MTAGKTMNFRVRHLLAAMPLLMTVPAFAEDFEKRLRQLMSAQPVPLFVVLEPDGVIAIQPDVQRMANEMPARIKKRDQSDLWFEAVVLVAAPVSSTKAKVVLEFKTRCAVLPAAAYELLKDDDVMWKAMKALVKIARDQRLNPQWSATCVMTDESLGSAYRQVMRFPSSTMQVRATNRLVYMTNVNSSLMFVF